MTSKPRRASSLQRFLLLVVVISVAVPATVAGYMLIRENYQRTVNYDAEETTSNYIELLQAGMTMPLWNIAGDLGQHLIDSVSIDPSVIQIRVVTSDGERFLSYEQDGIAQGAPVIRLVRDVVYENQVIGSVEIAYSLASARARAANETRLLLIIILCQLVFTILLVSYFLRRRVIYPLSELEQAAAGIAAGDLKTSIPLLKNDEFGSLSIQLEGMRGSLESSFSTLEDRVKERTIDLVEVNKELKHTLDQLKRTQGNLVQSEKLAALGSLVAGVAHELNTPLGNGLTVASSLKDESRAIARKMQDGITRKSMETYIRDMTDGAQLVVSSLERASELVSSFKQVAMDRTSAQRRHFELSSVLYETRITSLPAFKHTPYIIDIQCDDSIAMDSYPGPLGQIITNLLNNALIHAFEGADAGLVSIKGELLADRKCRITVTDDGAGIRPENINRIFDPFFTTKLGEGGNGLGMHIVHNMVTGVLGGTISVESELGVGTSFVLDLPSRAPTEDDRNNAPQLSNLGNDNEGVEHE